MSKTKFIAYYQCDIENRNRRFRVREKRYCKQLLENPELFYEKDIVDRREVETWDWE